MASKVCLGVAVLLFCLCACGVTALGPLGLLPLGLALFAFAGLL